MAEVKLSEDEMNAKYPSNSIVGRKQEKESVQPLVKGNTAVQKESLGKKFKRMIMPGDIRDAKSYVLNQIIIPGLKNGALAAMEMIFFGRVSGKFYTGPSNTISQNNRTNYSYISSSGARIDTRPTTMGRNQRETFSFHNVTFSSYDDAKDVVEFMLDYLDRNKVVCVGDFYTLCKIQTEYTDYDWGWRSFQRLNVKADRDCYYIDMQPPVYLK